MNNKFWLPGALTLCTVFTLASCSKNNDDPVTPPTVEPTTNAVVGYLYTSTNGSGPNQVVKFSRHEDGTLSDEMAFATNSMGGANVAAGGDAHGDFDAQGSVQIIGNYLLNVNAGGNNVSVFSIDNPTGNLTFKNNTNSGGTRPVSIAYMGKAGSPDEYWVVVANQWNNPNVQKDSMNIERYPNDAFFMGDLSLPDASDAERNIQLFSFNGTTGVLTSVKQLDKYVRENGGPTTVSFSDDGTKLAVSTWGVAHFNTANTSVTEQKPSRVYVYDFSNGDVSNERHFEEEGIAGSIGFNWAKNNNTTLYVSNFNLIPSKLDNSITVLSDGGTMVTKSSKHAVTTAEGINEACWTMLNPGGDKLYVASFATNHIASFNASGTNLAFDQSIARQDDAPAGDSKEIWISSDNKYLYNIGAFKSYSINSFEISAGELIYKNQIKLATTAADQGIVGKNNFLGLVGYDIAQ